MEGWKMKTAGILAGLAQALPLFVQPEIAGPGAMILNGGAALLGVWGAGHKLDKIRQAQQSKN